MRVLFFLIFLVGGCYPTTMVRTGTLYPAYDASHSIEFAHLSYADAIARYTEVGRLCVNASQDTWSQPGVAHDDIVEKAQALGGDLVTVIDHCTLGFGDSVQNDALKVVVFRKR